jgi:aspartate aminotransferase
MEPTIGTQTASGAHASPTSGAGSDTLSAERSVGLDPRLTGLGRSPTLAIQARSRERIARGERTYRLGLGQSPFPVPDVVVEALRASAAEKDYLPVEGLPALREAIAGYHRRRHDIARGPADVLIGPGTKELLFLLQLAWNGELLVPAPSWVSYAPQAQIAGRRVRWLSTRPEAGLRLEPDLLDAQLRALPRQPRILILNYPSNPTGATYGGDALRALARVLRDHQVIVLSDEIYGEVHFHGAHVSISRYLEESTILATGLSKWCGAGGWRLGSLTFPRELAWLREGVAILASETYSSTAAPIQHAAVRAFRPGPDLELYLSACRAVLAGLLGRSAEVLRAAGAELPSPEGGFYLFPTLAGHRARLEARGITDDVSLAERLLEETGVATLPGSVFGMDPAAHYLRLALVDFDGPRALTAVRPGVTVDDAFLDMYCAPTWSGVNALARWLGS